MAVALPLTMMGGGYRPALAAISLAVEGPAAVAAGLASYPGALVAALFVGVIEAFGSFWASAFKEVIVFTLILPVLLVRSLRSGHSDEDH